MRSQGLAQQLASTIPGAKYQTQMVNPPVSGRLFVRYKRLALDDVVTASIRTASMLFGTITKSASSVRGTMIIVLGLPRPVPNMVLMNARASVLRRAGVAIDKAQRLQLEGDFNTQFRLYCPKKYERDALYIFTPDVMVRLMNVTVYCDVELVDNRIILYFPPLVFRQAEEIEKLPDFLDYLLEKIEKQTVHYKDEREGEVSRSDPFLRDQIQALQGRGEDYRIAESGRRLHTRLTLLQKIGVGVSLLVALVCAFYWVASVIRAFF